MRPAGQLAVAGKHQGDTLVIAVAACHHPVDVAHQPVGRRGLAALVGVLNRLRVARQIAKPGPADRHAAPHRLSSFKRRFFAEPDDRCRLALSIAKYLGALLGDDQFGVSVTKAPAAELVLFDALNVDGHGQSRWQMGELRPCRRPGIPQAGRRDDWRAMLPNGPRRKATTGPSALCLQRPWQASARNQRSSSLKPCISTKAMIR